jgi:chitodextrinase
LQQGFTGVDDFYASFYLKLNAALATSARIARISNAGTTVGNLLLTSNRTLQLRNGSTTIGSPSAALTLGTVYRVGLHQKKGAGGNAILEAFLAAGDAAFPTTPFANIANGTWTTQANQLQFGATNGNAINTVFDDILLDAAAMPGPGGGTPPTPDTQPPTAPSGLVATALSASQIRLTWNPATDNIGVAGYRVYRNGGSTPIATVTSGASYTDASLAPATTYSYTVAAFDDAGNPSPPSALASATTQTTPPPTGQPIKAITFEGGSLTGAFGADSLSGSGVTLDTTTPLKGSASAQFTTASGYLNEDYPGVDDVFVSFYLRLNALPSSDARIIYIANAGTTVGNIVLRSTGALRLRVGTTTIGESAPLAIKPAYYRVGLHQKRGTGANAVLEAFVAPASAPSFGTPFAATTIGAWTTQANRQRFGATNGLAINAVFDEIILDSAAMPGP